MTVAVPPLALSLENPDWTLLRNLGIGLVVVLWLATAYWTFKDARTTDRAALIELREPLLHRLDLELALARILDVLGRPEEHVDDRPEERWEEADDRRQRHEPRVLDPSARVLERPVGGREPENDDEADAEVSEKGPVGILERQCKLLL